MHRFLVFSIEDVTLENYREVLPSGLALQVEDFIPPRGSFDDLILRRYLENIKLFELSDLNNNLSLANRLRLAFADMTPDTICTKFPTAELSLKRRLRCVAEYLIRNNELEKQVDENGKLIKRRGALGKPVVIYQPLPKLRSMLVRQNLLEKQ